MNKKVLLLCIIGVVVFMVVFALSNQTSKVRVNVKVIYVDYVGSVDWGTYVSKDNWEVGLRNEGETLHNVTILQEISGATYQITGLDVWKAEEDIRVLCQEELNCRVRCAEGEQAISFSVS